MLIGVGLPTNAHATAFNVASFTVNVPTEGVPAGDLKLNIIFSADPAVPPIPFVLTTVNQSISVPLGVLGTNESTVNDTPGDDLEPQAISIDWVFDLPSAFGGQSTGTTVGILDTIDPIELGCGPILGGCGQVTWNALELQFGNTGRLGITLNDGLFGTPGLFGITIPHPLELEATFTLLALDTSVNPTTPVPEPASLMLLGSGLAAVAARARKRNKA